VLQPLDVGPGGGGGGGLAECYGALCELVSQCDRLCTALRRHQRVAGDVDRRKAEWRGVALVLDRRLLLVVVTHWSVSGQWSLGQSCLTACCSSRSWWSRARPARSSSRALSFRRPPFHCSSDRPQPEVARTDAVFNVVTKVPAGNKMH